MLIVRTSLAGLMLVALAGLASGQQKSCQKGCAPSRCDPCESKCGGKGGDGPCKGLVTCHGQKQGCTVECDTETISGNRYKCGCTTICLPAKDFGLGGGCGKGGDTCGPCQTGCGIAKGSCDQKGDCGKGGSLLDFWKCKPRAKKHLLVKKVDVCELPTITCGVTGKGKGCGKGYEASVPADAPLGPPAELEGGGEGGTPLDAAPEIPEPPPINLGRALRSNRTTPRYTRNGMFELLLR